jgi:[protein-PII] uridylyltransferase
VTITEPREARSRLLERHRLRGSAFCAAYAAEVDGWLAGLFARAAGQRDGLALVAVGGHGRRELCPGSDLDLVLLHDGARDVGAIADALWYPVWDSGLQLDHSVRTARESLAVADSDLKAMLGLLRVRHVAGDAALTTSLAEAVRRRWSDRRATWLPALRDAQRARWERHGEAAFLLEPDLKNARGGLRDYEALLACSYASPVVEPVLDDPRLAEAYETLLTVRVALHAVTAKRGDLLTLDAQDAVARRLGHADAEELVPLVAGAARRVAWAGDQAWRRTESWLAGPQRGSLPRPLAPGIVLRDGELHLDGDLAPETPLRIAAASARTGAPIAAQSLLRLEAEATPPPEPWPEATRDALVDLLGCGAAGVPLVETLDHLGVLGRYVREWGAVRSRPQRNAYHRFTVDRHLCEAAAEAARLTRRVRRPDLLLVAAWLHDIGKGYPGDHTEAGVRIVTTIATRMGFAPDDVALLARLVDNHLLLADTATKRDLTDPATIAKVTALVPTADELDLLAALTQADSIATGTSAWSGWKAALVDELVLRAKAGLAGETVADTPSLPAAEHRTAMARGTLDVTRDGSRVTVVAPDRPGLLGVVAGVLTANGLRIRTATAAAEGAMAVQVYDVEERDRVDDARLAADVATYAADPGALEVRLRARDRGGPLRRVAVPSGPPVVTVDNAGSDRATVVEVRAPDDHGVLTRVAAALCAGGCDIVFARVLTFGHEVVDTFYVRDQRTGGKVTDAARLDRLRAAVLAAL